MTRISIVEDDAMNRDALSRRVAGTGYSWTEGVPVGTASA
jgi:CheY-like chemotaxis protein